MTKPSLRRLGLVIHLALRPGKSQENKIQNIMVGMHLITRQPKLECK